ncbi:MAG: efflux RND transporter permease subunit, partial [Rhodospirillales bacterium]|nr:efflux RND transporter permease subunit [Rhodospirillales bacterium]
MSLIRLSIERPIAVVAAVIMVVMFGLVALKTIPIQLTPDIRRPVITIRTWWPGAAVAEMEREVTNRQEDALRGLEGLKEIQSSSSSGYSRVTLEFGIGQNMDKALLLVSNRLDRVTGYPSEVKEPSLDTAGSDDIPIAYFVLTPLPGNTRSIQSYRDFIESELQERMQRVPGIAEVRVWGGSNRELVVTIDPAKMARYGLTVPDVVDKLRAANASISAGDMDEGKRSYVVRTEGEFKTPEQVRAVVLRTLSNIETGRVARVTVQDIAEVDFGFKERDSVIRYLGRPGLSINAVGETGNNVIETMRGVRAVVEELNQRVLPEAGLKLVQVYDETTYINSAISLVKQNVYVGGALAALVLLLFLRSGAATLVVALAIPVSVIGAFVAMAGMGRSINVISLAGIAFAVGMVVDAAIVVLENIYRLTQEGRSRKEAAYLGAKQVWVAVLVSSLTTVMVFMPVLVMDLPIGQLFRDIAVAVSVSVLLSLLVAVTVIPALANRMLRDDGGASRLRLPGIDDLARGMVNLAIRYTRHVSRHRVTAVLMVAGICGVTAISTYLFLPKLEYLPEGNRNLVIGRVLPPPGYNLQTANEIANDIETQIKPHWASETGPESKAGEPPKIDHFFFVARRSHTFIRASSVDPQRAGDLVPIIRKAVFREPGVFGLIVQPSMFGRTIGGGRSINLDISGPDLEDILNVAQRSMGMIGRILPRREGTQVRPRPGLELGAPEVKIIPDPLRLADNGVSVRDLGSTVDAFNDGLRVAEITVDGERIDLTVRGPKQEITQTQGIENLPVVTRSGKVLPASSLADVVVTSGPTQLRHIDWERTVTLQIKPPNNMPLEQAMDMIRSDVMEKSRADGLPPGVKMRMSGTADQLTQAWDQMVIDLAIAIAIVYLVMAVLF